MNVYDPLINQKLMNNEQQMNNANNHVEARPVLVLVLVLVPVPVPVAKADVEGGPVASADVFIW